MWHDVCCAVYFLFSFVDIHNGANVKAVKPLLNGLASDYVMVLHVTLLKVK